MKLPVIPSGVEGPGGWAARWSCHPTAQVPRLTLGMTAVLLLIAFVLACATKPVVVPPVIDEATRGTIKQLTDAIAQQPTNMPWIYVLATYHDKAGETDHVVRLLTRLDELGWQHGVSPAAFRNSRGSAFRNIVAKLDAREPRASNAKTAFTIAGQRDRVPEGIAYDPQDDVFYVSGIYRRKVIRVDRTGRAIDFVKEGQDGEYFFIANPGLRSFDESGQIWPASKLSDPVMVKISL